MRLRLSPLTFLLAAGAIRVDAPEADITKPVRETVRPYAKPFVVTQRTAMSLMAMTARHETQTGG